MGIYIIAEAGVNHNGSLDTAKRMIEEAKKAGADCIKFQTFKTESLVTRKAGKAGYQIKQTGNSESQYEMLKKLELSEDSFYHLKRMCDEMSIDFLSTAFDVESIQFLKKLKMGHWKVPSGEITNLPYMEEIAAAGGEVILSTGMATMDEIAEAIQVLKNNKIHLLHCTTEYPAEFSSVNLSAMITMKQYFGLPVGYSDHTAGIEVAIAAAALGAEIIEKHFTLDQTMDGPDHKASLEPKRLREMITSIRNIEEAVGNGVKRPTEVELKNRLAARKSIVAKKKIHKGEILTSDNMTVKRPGSGISPMRWYELLGKEVSRDFDEDELITIDGVKE